MVIVGKELTDYMKDVLDGKDVEDRRKTLKTLYELGFSVGSYLEELLASVSANSVRVNKGNPEALGFKSTTYAGEKIVIYTLDLTERIKQDFMFQELPDGSYRRWP